ncbi:MAG: peptidyl-prolyl cis-trans isomerase, partial [Clostridia bacterium]|nr:peptidyl-prolyl cis-trans isomerase [Clostridia bacterium]
DTFMNIANDVAGDKIYSAIEGETPFTDEDLAKECEDNKSTYYSSDYLSLEIKASYTTGASDDVIKEAKADAKADAEAILAKATDAEAFKKAIEEYYREVYNVVPDETEDEAEKTETTEETTEEETEDKREKLTESALTEKIEKALTEGSAYTVETDLGKWLYEQDSDGKYIRAAGDSKLIEDATNGKYTVYVVVNPMYRADYKLRDVRHILIKVDSYDKTNGLPDADAKAKAEQLLQEWKDGDATEDSFGELAKKNSMDTDPSNGGLYEGVYKGQMVAEFEDWLFAAKEVGETGIVKTTYGYHVMYYVGEGEDIKWESDAEANLRAADYTKAYEALTEKFPVTVSDEKAFKKIKQAGT